MDYQFILDHDHLWFDPNWKHIGSNSSTCNNRQLKGSTVGHGINPNEDDPMAAMLENNAKNKNATNIFLNQLHNIKSNDIDNGAPEYAEVDGLVSQKQTILMTDINQGPYATTTLVDPPRLSSVSSHSNNTVSNSSSIFMYPNDSNM